MNLRRRSIAPPISSLWTMSPAAAGVLDDVADERVDPRRAGRAEPLDLLGRQVALGDDPGADGVVDVVVDVGDAVDESHDPALERRRLQRAGVVEDPVAHLVGQVEPVAVPLEVLDQSQRVLVVTEAGRRRAP